MPAPDAAASSGSGSASTVSSRRMRATRRSPLAARSRMTSSGGAISCRSVSPNLPSLARIVPCLPCLQDEDSAAARVDCRPGQQMESLTMEYRRLGVSGLVLSALSFGAWTTFGKGVARGEARNLVAAAWDNGINFFDNAEGYAHGEAERVMGDVIRSEEHTSELQSRENLVCR